jgi:hypothetical protein
MAINRKAVASQMVTELEQEIGALRLKLQTMQHQLMTLEGQRDAAKILAGMKLVKVSARPTVEVLRARNLSEVVFQFLRDRCPQGAAAVELQNQLAGAGIPPGSRTYIFKILTDLATKGRVQKGEDGKWRALPEASE